MLLVKEVNGFFPSTFGNNDESSRFMKYQAMFKCMGSILRMIAGRHSKSIAFLYIWN